MTQTAGTGTTIYIHCETLESGYHAVAIDESEPIEYCWIARCPELPGCKTDGRTAQEAINDLRELIPEFIAWLREDGLHIPAPDEHLGQKHWDHMTAYTPRGNEE